MDSNRKDPNWDPFAREREKQLNQAAARKKRSQRRTVVVGLGVTALLAGTINYALTGFACCWFFRGTLRESPRNLWFRGILPLAGALLLTAAFFISAVQMWDPAYGDTRIFGVGGAFVSGVALLALGVVLALVCRFLPATRGYFQVKP
ncbi:hypothetical protein GCM10007170_12190 [Arthrobacter liuii]|uniref:Uncharacterized protein n=1 Tax=Arthrobacter liuii TaxID=1476996 RepID=A0ABQ2AJX5_9MICC|nr:hypothetical protein GCM10007170_12190 [Arthrobacter liuii]